MSLCTDAIYTRPTEKKLCEHIQQQITIRSGTHFVVERCHVVHRYRIIVRAVSDLRKTIAVVLVARMVVVGLSSLTRRGYTATGER